MDTKDTTLFIALIISCVVIGLIIIFFVISIVRQQRLNLELHRQNILAEITTLETERSRMSADLHDELGPLLTSIKFQIESVDALNDEEQQLLHTASQRIDEVIGRLRAIAKNLMPASLARKGLVVALNEFILVTNKTNAIKIEFEAKIDKVSDLDININIFRILQEIIQNTIKHSGASKILLQLKEEDKQILILCQDNGRGFNYTETMDLSSGLGLRNINSRIEIMGGKLQVDSDNKKGTHYFITIPIPNSNNR